MSDQKNGAPEWIVTFSDIVSLLVTFFILILTWSTLENDNFELIAGSLQGALGVVGLTSDKCALVERSQLRSARDDNQGALNPAEEELADNPYAHLAVRLRKQLGETIDFDKLRQAYRIRVRADALFRPGSADLEPSCRSALDAIAVALARREELLRVEGHTDDRFEPSPRYPTAWELSVARAAAAARHLVEAGGIAPERVSVAGYAGYRPAVPNRSPALRARNRRVDIMILRHAEGQRGPSRAGPPQARGPRDDEEGQ